MLIPTWVPPRELEIDEKLESFQEPSAQKAWWFVMAIKPSEDSPEVQKHRVFSEKLCIIKFFLGSPCNGVGTLNAAVGYL